MSMKSLIQGGAALAVFAWTASAADAGTILASTSFENEPVFPNVQYRDTGDAAVDHDLVNNADEPVVDSTTASSDAGDLGFDARYENTRDGVGLTDGDFVGVTDFTDTVGAYTDGVQGYQLSDVDGKMIVSFNPVDISGSPVEISLDRFISETGWEADDAITISVVVDAGPPIDILNTTGSDIDDLDLEGMWVTEKLQVTGSSAVLSVSLDSNAGGEAIFVDNVVFTQVPEPTAIALLAALGLGVVGMRYNFG